MASPAPANFLTAWRRQSVKPVLLVQIDLTDPTARTVRLASIPITTPDGSLWEPLIYDCEPIESPGAFLSTGPDLCTLALILFNKRLAYQAAGKALTHAFNDYRWEGATITVYAWEQSIASFSDKFQIFKGVVSHYEPDQTTIRVPCIQRSDWNRVITPTFVNRKTYPNAPDKSIGLPLPIVIGNGSARPMRKEWLETLGASRDRFDRCGGAIPTVNGVLVDNGAGASGSKARVVFASHDVNNLGDASLGVSVFLNTKTEHPAGHDPTGEVFTTATESGFTVPDNSDKFYYTLIPTDVAAPANPASEPRYALDPGNELTYALIDYDASKRDLKLPLLSVDPPGEYVSARPVMGYKTIGGATNLRLSFFNDVSLTGTTVAVSASTTPTTMYGASIATTEPATPWDFSRCNVRVEFVGVGTGVICHVYFIGLEVRYKPRREFIRMAKRVEVRTTTLGGPEMPRGHERPPGDPGLTVQTKVSVSRPVMEFEAEFCGNIIGQEDDGSGTYTGTIGAVIERPHHIAHYLLRTYLEQTAGQVHVGGGLHGDFSLLNTSLITHNNKSQVYFLRVDREMPGEDALVAIARDALAWFHISRFTDKWHAIAWKPGSGVAYDVTLEPKHVIGDSFRCRLTPKSRVLTGVRVRYLWDVFRKNFIGEVRIAHDGSGAGYHYDNLRDQYMTVVTGLNDKINFHRNGTDFTATLGAGDYTPTTLLQEVSSEMTAAASAAICIGWGSLIVATFNAGLPFNDGSDKTATLTAGLYSTMGALATEVAARLNALSSNWSCTYSLTTKKFTISRSAGTAELKFSGAADAAAALGFKIKNYTGLSSYTSDFETEQERFILTTAEVAFSLLWESGANGLNGTRTDAAELLGWSNLRDLTGANGYVAPCPKNNQEQKLVLAKSRYQARRTLPIDADTILDTDTARAVANRLVDLESEPRVTLEFETSWFPDLERGRVLSVSGDFDATHPYPKYGSNGSWVGKKLWVTSVRQHAVRRWHQEVSCIEAD